MSRANLKKKGDILYLIIPLILSVVINFWNPIGFPTFHVDEGIYMGRVMHILEGDGPLEIKGIRTPYDHPFFGQIFLAAVLGSIGYPDSFENSANGDARTVEMVYMVPRVLMGLLTVTDTFLVYKIAEQRYRRNKTIAFIAAVLFAVMPITWILRRIYLDNLAIPFVLASILFAMYARKPSQNYDNRLGYNRNAIITASISGIFLGLAIFTKIPSFIFVPLVAYLVFANSRSLKVLGLWLIPVIMIPAIWPIYSIAINESADWLYGVEHQSRKGGKPLAGAMQFFFDKDPILFLAGSAGLIFAALKRDYFVLLWAIPFFLFFFLVDWVSYFHLPPIVLIFCLAAAPALAHLFDKIPRKKLVSGHIIKCVLMGSIVVFGFVCSLILVTTNVTSGFFMLNSFIVDYLPNYNDSNNKSFLVGSYWTEMFTWVPQYIFDKDIQYIREGDLGTHGLLENLERGKIIFIVDRNIRTSMEEGNKNLEALDGITDPVRIVDQRRVDEYDRSAYPFNSLDQNRGIGRVIVMAN
jgi:hypothetical protein